MSAAPGSHGAPTFVVCEDGHEYSERFTRLLGSEFCFLRAGHHAEALSLSNQGRASGLLLDLDFRRTPVAALIDEQGATRAARPDSERQRLAAIQGILVLRALRAAGVILPALLFADIEDREQITFLQSSLAPLQVVPGAAGIAAIAAALRSMATGPLS